MMPAFFKMILNYDAIIFDHNQVNSSATISPYIHGNYQEHVTEQFITIYKAIVTCTC